jgi:predicted nucleotidyltransferase component of viral defense system
VRYESATAFRQALLAQLRKLAKETGIPLEHLRKRVVFERLLGRLLTVAPDRWVLKGALALDLGLESSARTTKDADLVGPLGIEEATEDLLSAQVCDLGDYFAFRLTRSREANSEEPEATVRFHVTAEVAGSVFDEAVIDVEIRQRIEWEPETVKSHLLAFAGVAAVIIPVVPAEIQVAEKIHAYTRPYGRSQLPTTRVKDLVDLVVIVEVTSLDADRLQTALQRTFAGVVLTLYPDCCLRLQLNGPCHTGLWRFKRRLLPIWLTDTAKSAAASTQSCKVRRQVGGIPPQGYGELTHVSVARRAWAVVWVADGNTAVTNSREPSGISCLARGFDGRGGGI